MIDILIFVLFLCPLIFFHELGHFLFARLFGVRVEVFSIGFGPKIFAFKKGDTEYTISLIPFGGYVKMFGDDPLSDVPIPESEQKYAFTHKSKWARFWVAFGGPLANFILAFVIFFFLLVGGEKIPQAKFGMLKQDSFLYQQGVRPLDHLKKINDIPLLGLAELNFAENDVIQTIEVERQGTNKTIKMHKTFREFMNEFFQYPPQFRSPLLVDYRGNSYAVTKTKGQVDWDQSLEEINLYPPEEVYLYRLKNNMNGPFQSAQLKDNPPINYASEQIIKLSQLTTSLVEHLISMRYYPIDLKVSKLVPHSPASKAGLRDGDILVKMDGHGLSSFDNLRELLQETKKNGTVVLSIIRQTEIQDITVFPEVEGQDESKVVRIGVYSSGRFIPIAYTHSPPRSFMGSLAVASQRTWDSMVKTLEGFKKLVTNQASFKSLGGPLAIGKVANDSFDIGLSYFFKLMALISVNLGIINLFPIPVLDGGHILFIFFELINRGPLSRKKLEMAQQFGISVLLLLLLAALFNDFTRLFNPQW